MTEAVALQVGVLLAASGTRDVVDAHVALLARSLGAVVITSDAEDLARLDDSLELVTIELACALSVRQPLELRSPRR